MQPRWARVNNVSLLIMASLLAMAGLAYLLVRGPGTEGPRTGQGTADEQLLVYCAAGMRYPMEEIAAAYEHQFGVPVQLQYGGSNTLLNQLEVSRVGVLYVAADTSYVELARQ